LDVPQLRYSALVNGMTEINLTKLDVLDGLKVRACVCFCMYVLLYVCKCWARAPAFVRV
jgi:adenylosuccinate synthase